MVRDRVRDVPFFFLSLSLREACVLRETILAWITWVSDSSWQDASMWLMEEARKCWTSHVSGMKGFPTLHFVPTKTRWTLWRLFLFLGWQLLRHTRTETPKVKKRWLQLSLVGEGYSTGLFFPFDFSRLFRGITLFTSKEREREREGGEEDGV